MACSSSCSAAVVRQPRSGGWRRGSESRPAPFALGLRRGSRETCRSLRMSKQARSALATDAAAGTASEAAAAAAASFPFDTARSGYLEAEEKRGRDPVTDENLDSWLRESIGEIVRCIGEAPVLVQVFRGNGGAGVRLEKEAASPERWSRIKRSWERGSVVPEGVILVEELEGRWGLVVQGRGMDCAACYILETCRVPSAAGFCTHFCLVRAKCFGDPAEAQLGQAWLL